MADSNEACQASNDGCYWPRGKMVGGSSSMNYMLYSRGGKPDYDNWAEPGNLGWDYDNVLPYLKKLEGNQYAPFVEYKNGMYHNASGPVKISFFDHTSPFEQFFLDAATEAGYPIIDDINADATLGVVKLQGFYANGKRQSAAKAYLIPAKNRTNLHIIKHAFVEKILIANSNVAYGVRFRYRGKHILNAFARKEVILSAGSVNSPPLLMLSGIGPRNVLKKHKIPIKSDLAVGHNLYDHLFNLVWYKGHPTQTSPTEQLDSLYQYITNATGPLADTIAKILIFADTTNGTGPPDFILGGFHFARNSTDLQLFISHLNYKDEIREILLNENQNHDIYIVSCSQLYPKSKGYIELSSLNPYDKPIIKAEYLTHPQDVEDMIRATKRLYHLASTETYQEKGVQMIHFPIKECDCHEFQSDEYTRCYAKYFSTTAFHPVGTSKMGPDSDPEAVVDARLRVRNIRNLRQIDAGM